MKGPGDDAGAHLTPFRAADQIAAAHQLCYHDAMVRTTISLPEGLVKRLRVMAAERGTSMAGLIREALEQTAASHRPRPRSLGIGASGHADTARRTAEERPEPRASR